MASLPELENGLRNSVLADLRVFCEHKYDADIIDTASNTFSFPAVDEEGNDRYVKIVVSIPRGKRAGPGMGYIPYNAYSEKEQYIEDQRIKEEERLEKAREREEEARRRAERLAQIE